MNPEETGGDQRVVELLDEATQELQAGRAVESSTWQARESKVAQLAPDLPELLETLRDLVSAAHTWRTGAPSGQLPSAEPETPPYHAPVRHQVLAESHSTEPTVDELSQEAGSGPLPEQIGRYRVLERIAGGGMGAVYKAYDPELDRIVALKVPRFDRLADLQAAVKQRFLREARTAAQIRHAHVCPIHDVGEHDGIPFVVMAYVEGQSLSGRLRERGRFDDPREPAELIRQVADGLAAVHAHGILHRDVKPGNILIDLSGQALLADFGLALPVNDPEHLTSTGIMVGTVAYMAPEQTDAALGTIGPWTDLYGLGVVLYQMLTGRLPFEGPPLTVLSRIAHEGPPLPTKFRPDLDPGLEAIINKAMARQAEERYQSAPEFAEALQHWLSGIASEPTTTSAAAPTQTSTPVVVRSDLPDGGTVTVSVQHGSTAPRKLSVTVSEQESKKRRRRRRLAIQVSVAFAVVLVVIGFSRWFPETKDLLPGGEKVRVVVKVDKQRGDPGEAVESGATGYVVSDRSARVSSVNVSTLNKFKLAHPAEIIQIQYSAPTHASLAVRADPALLHYEAGQGAVVLMLDCSGSMCSPYDSEKATGNLPKFLDRPKKDSRFDKAVRAIGKVLDGIEPGTNLSFWVFSDKQAGGPFGRRLRDLTPWKKEQKTKLMDEIEKLHPWSDTPLVRSMWEAKADFTAHLTGFKTMIVLTDGEDDQFKKNNQLSIPQFLTNEFKDSGIQLNLVFYEVSDPGERERIRDSFKCIEDKSWPTPGKLYLEKDEDKLAAFLIRALRPNLRYWVENPNDGTAPPGLANSLEVSAQGANDQWISNGLAPGAYNIWAQQTDPQRQKILCERGDLLLMQLNHELKFEPLVFSKEDYPGKANIEKDGWRLAVLQNQALGDRSLQMLTTLERHYDANAIPLQQAKPQEVWLEVSPSNNGPSPYTFRWAKQFGYPAPAWSIDVANWPVASDANTLSRPQLRAWWSPDQEAPAAAVLQRGVDFQALADFVGKPVQVEGDQVKIESLSCEEHLVEVEPGHKEPKPCLLVRLAYAKDKPVWVKIGPGPIEGFENHFDMEANKYTGIFWPVPKDAEAFLVKFAFISLEAFKRDAERRGFAVKMDLGVPEPGDTRPSPRLLLK
jgi:serine/threonine protein kinase